MYAKNMKNRFTNAKFGGFVYTFTLLSFMVIVLIERAVSEIAGASITVKYAVNAFFPAIVFIFAFVLYSKNKGKTPYIRKCSPAYSLPVLLLAFGMLFGLGFLNSVIAEGIDRLGGVAAKSEIPLETPFQYILFTVLLCALPAVAEELFFRGVLLDSLSETGTVLRTLSVALCFALYHGNAVQIAYQFVYGLGLCILTIKSKSLIPAVAAHFINNFAVLTIEYFNIPVNLFSPVTIAAGVVLLVLFAAFTAFFGGKSLTENGKTERMIDFYVPFGIVGIAVSALAVILSVIPVS